MNAPPILDAYRHPDGVHFVVFRPDCRFWHWHSAENGCRAAHCSRVYLSMRGPELVCEPNNGSLYKTGYILREKGPISKQIVLQQKVRRGFARSKPKL
jgi:hypothetical protein